MSLSEKLTKATSDASIKLCKIGALLASDQLTSKDRDNLKSVLEVPEFLPGRVSSASLGRILRGESLNISNSAVERHRRGDCVCVKAGK